MHFLIVEIYRRGEPFFVGYVVVFEEFFVGGFGTVREVTFGDALVDPRGDLRKEGGERMCYQKVCYQQECVITGCVIRG